MYKRDLLKRAAGWSAGMLGRVLPPRTPRCGVLIYHRTCEHPQEAAAPTWNVTPQRLRMQLAGLRARGFRFPHLDEVLDALQAGRPFPRDAVVVTFDDGYENNFENALPILKELNVPACFFVATAYIDSQQPLPFDRWAVEHQQQVAETAWKPITRASLERMLVEPLVSIGSHTHTHPIHRSHNQEFEADLARSLEVLEHLGVRRPAFAFPAGRSRLGYFSEQMLLTARRLGVRCAMTTDGASPLHSVDGFLVGRFNAFEWDTPSTLEGKLCGWFEWAPRLQEWVEHRRQANLQREPA